MNCIQPSRSSERQPAAVGILLVGCLVALAGALAGPNDDSSSDREFLPGLVAQYDDGECRVVEVVDSVAFSLSNDASIHPALRPTFKAVWTGFLNVFESGDYHFSAGAAELVIDGDLVWSDQPVLLVAGRHPLRVTYEGGGGAASLELRWRSESFSTEPIPSGVFSHRGDAPALDTAASVDRGRTLVNDYGCVHCHAAPAVNRTPRSAPTLDGVGGRLNTPWIYKWLQSPVHFRADAAMPDLPVLAAPQKRRDVTAYLAELNEPRVAPPRSRVESPAADGAARGQELYERIGCRACHEQNQLSLDGVGSKWLRGALIEYLKEPASVNPNGRMPSFLLTDDEAGALAAYLLRSRIPAFEKPIPDWRHADPKNGEKIVRAAGCLSCHELAGQRHQQRPPAPPALAAVSTGAGCLAEPAPAHVPRYRFSSGDLLALRSFLEFFKKFPDRSAAPLFNARRKLVELRCTSCHVLGNRVPSLPLVSRVPTLTDVGAKLKTSWIAEVIEKKKRIRPYLEVRMPHFAPAHVDGLAETLTHMAGVDRKGESEGSPKSPDAAAGLVAAGVALLGSDAEKGGLSCIVCHDFLDHQPIADEKGPQMVETTDRLRFDWFRRWILNPGRIASGTAMPQYFSPDRRQAAETAISQLWAALSLGDRVPRPVGIDAESFVGNSETLPAPTEAPVIVRFLMPGVTAAAIAVGLPPSGDTPGISYCFDAATCHLVYAWRGGFIDLRDSIGKVSEPAKILGEIYHRVGSFPLRVGTIQRKPARRFRGYRMVDGSPRFHYEVDGTSVHERVVAAGGAGRDPNGHVHEFLIERVTKPTWFVLDGASSKTIKLTSTIGRFEGTRLRIPNGDNVRFEVRVLMGEEP